MKPIKRDSFIFYKSFHEATKHLPDTERLEVFDALFLYAIEGIESELSGITNSIFVLIKPQIDANNKRFKNGKNGGRPKAYKGKPKPNQSRTKAEPNDNVNVNVNVNENIPPNSPEGKTLVVPDFVDADTWNDFVKHRGKNFSTLAATRIINSLTGWHEEGQDVNKILNNSIMNDWKGVFPEKGTNNGKPTKLTADEVARNMLTEIANNTGGGHGLF